MPPKKIKLITKEVKEVKDIKVDSKDIDTSTKIEQDVKVKVKEKIKIIKKQKIEKPLENIISSDKGNKIIKVNDIDIESEGKEEEEVEADADANAEAEKKEINEEEDGEEDDEEKIVDEDGEEKVDDEVELEDEENDEVKDKNIDAVAKNKKMDAEKTIKTTKIESEKNKTNQKSKQKQSNVLKQTETSFDMFGSNNIDYRETMLNYDCSKNKTLPKLTKYEIALVIGKRAKQIEDGANPNIKVMPGKNSIEIAEEELRQGVIPFYIKRPIGNSFELFKLADMEFYLD